MIAFRKQRRAQTSEDFETWIESSVSNTINLFDGGDARATTIVIEIDERETDSGNGEEVWRIPSG